MKRHLNPITLVLLLAVPLLFSACKKDNATDGANDALGKYVQYVEVQVYVECTLDGQPGCDDLWCKLHYGNGSTTPPMRGELGHTYTLTYQSMGERDHIRFTALPKTEYGRIDKLRNYDVWLLMECRNAIVHYSDGTQETRCVRGGGGKSVNDEYSGAAIHGGALQLSMTIKGVQ